MRSNTQSRSLPPSVEPSFHAVRAMALALAGGLLVVASGSATAGQAKGALPPPPIVVTASNPGLIPDATQNECGIPGPALALQFTVPVFSGLVEDVDVSLTFGPMHPFAGDVTAVLRSPEGRRTRTLFGRTGAVSSIDCGDSSDLLGPYVFSDAATPPSGGWWQAAVAAIASTPVASGSYFTTDAGGVGAVNPMRSTSLAGIFRGMNSEEASGVWHVYITDAAGNDTGGISAAQLTLHLRTPAPGSLIYSNGVIETGTVSGSTLAPAGNMWSQLQGDSGGAMHFNSGSGFNGNATVSKRLADDFSVPPGQSWQLSGAVLLAYATDAPVTPSPFTTTTLRIWNGPPGEAQSTVLCGDTVTNRLVDSASTNLLRVPHPGAAVEPPGSRRLVWRNLVTMTGGCDALVLQPGNYWLDWASEAVDDRAHFYPANTYIGARTMPGDNARQVEDGEWVPALDTGFQSEAEDVPVDFPFQLLGTIGPQASEVFSDGFETPIN